MSKSAAIYSIIGAIADTGSISEQSEREAVAGTYITRLDQHDALTSLAANRGSGRSRSRSRTYDGREEPEEENTNGADQHKKPRATTPVSSSPTNKRFTDESLYPWHTAEAIAEVTLSDSLKLTHKMVINYTADLKYAKWSLLSSKFVPDFPDAEWNNILSGKSVNLDSVFSRSLSTATNNRTVETLGEFKLLFGATKPSKTVETHGDWVTAWGPTSRATRFAFPHRERELDAYRDYITGYFAATHPKFHWKILELDKSI